MLEQHTKFSTFEIDWIENVSKAIGQQLFAQGIHYNRAEDVAKIAGVLEIVISELKKSAKFDIDLLYLSEIKEKFIGTRGSTVENSTGLTQLFYGATSYTWLGYATSGIQIAQTKLTPNFIQQVASAISLQHAKIAKVIDPTNAREYDKATFAAVDAIKKEHARDNPLLLQEWVYASKRVRDEVVEVDGKSFTLPVYIRQEFDESGQSYPVISPIVNGALLEAFAKDKRRGDKNLNSWLQKKVKEWEDDAVVADIVVDIDNAYDQGSYLKGIDLSGSNIRNFYVSDVDCRDMKLRNCDIDYLHIGNSLYSGLDLRGADLNNVRIDEAQFKTGAEVGFSGDELAKDKEGKIYLGVADLDRAQKHGVITESLRRACENRAALSPFYVRGIDEGEMDAKRKVVDCTRSDVEAYLKEIGKLKIVQQIKNGQVVEVDWIKSGIPTFSEYIAKQKKLKGEISVNLSNISLDALDLSGGNFSRVNFNNTKMNRVNAQHCNFFGCCLEGVSMVLGNFTHSVFAQSNMQYIQAKAATFDYCNLNDANLERAQLRKIHAHSITARRINLRFADLESADVQASEFLHMRGEGITLAQAHAQRCNFIGAKMVRAILKQSYFDEADFTGAVLTKANAISASFKNSIMEKINAERANFHHAILEEVSAREGNFDEAFMESVKARYATFEQANLNYLHTKKADFSHAILHEARALGADFTQTVLKHIDGSQINLAYATLNQAKLQHANLEKAFMQHAQAGMSHFEEAYLGEADLRFADLKEAILERANLEKVKLAGANLRGAKVTNANLLGVEVDSSTNLVDVSGLNQAQASPELVQQYEQQQRHNRPFKYVANKIADVLGTWPVLLKALKGTMIGLLIGFVVASLVLLFAFPAAAAPAALIILGSGCIAGASLAFMYSWKKAYAEHQVIGKEAFVDKDACGPVAQEKVHNHPFKEPVISIAEAQSSLTSLVDSNAKVRIDVSKISEQLEKSASHKREKGSLSHDKISKAQSE